VRLRAVQLVWLVTSAGLGMYWAYAAHAPGPKRDQAPASVIDLLIQKVWINPGGRVLPADPFACRSSNYLRRLRIGQALPYPHHDQLQPGHPDGMQ
jgi:hypothetical protein